MHFYADDTILYTTSSPTNQAFTRLQSGFDDCYNSLVNLKFVLNSKKTCISQEHKPFMFLEWSMLSWKLSNKTHSQKIHHFTRTKFVFLFKTEKYCTVHCYLHWIMEIPCMLVLQPLLSNHWKSFIIMPFDSLLKITHSIASRKHQHSCVFINNLNYILSQVQN